LAYNGIPVSQFYRKKELQKVAADTWLVGTGLLGTSAWYAPAHSLLLSRQYFD
jgi:hypothetical protein